MIKNKNWLKNDLIIYFLHQIFNCYIFVINKNIIIIILIS